MLTFNVIILSRSSPENIVKFIDECIGLDEYYIIYDNFTKLVCETDHGELLFIDINESGAR